MKKFALDLTVTDVEHLHSFYVLIKLTHTSPLPDMCPGQFVEILVEGSPTTFLRRPISINYVDYERNELWLLIKTVGDGTRRLAETQVNDTLNVLFPLGNGFTIPKSSSQRQLLVGGGVGTAPLLFLGHKIAEAGGRPDFLLGVRSKTDLMQADQFSAIGSLYVTSEDGSIGEKGFVTQHSVLRTAHYTNIYTCGPKPMMMSVARYAKQQNIECEASLENMMACGLGACLCCVEKTVEGNLCVCKDGPVFNIKQLLWQI
jgi:dihydroorotate dehydrogenase electron transfer subunit